MLVLLTIKCRLRLTCLVIEWLCINNFSIHDMKMKFFVQDIKIAVFSNILHQYIGLCNIFFAIITFARFWFSDKIVINLHYRIPKSPRKKLVCLLLLDLSFFVEFSVLFRNFHNFLALNACMKIYQVYHVSMPILHAGTHYIHACVICMQTRKRAWIWRMHA